MCALNSAPNAKYPVKIEGTHITTKIGGTWVSYLIFKFAAGSKQANVLICAETVMVFICDTAKLMPLHFGFSATDSLASHG